jgi:hypothetical protein
MFKDNTGTEESGYLLSRREGLEAEALIADILIEKKGPQAPPLLSPQNPKFDWQAFPRSSPHLCVVQCPRSVICRNDWEECLT